jgi:hypothetical protein
MVAKKFRNAVLILLSVTALTVGSVKPARADFFGGDLPLLSSILAQAIQQLAQLRQILVSGHDTLGLLRDVNQGIRDAMSIIRTMNRTLQPGTLSQLQTVEDMLRAIQEIYGSVPRTPESKQQSFTDRSVSEAMTLHNQAFAYADMVDPEAERIKDYSRVVSPVGAGRLTAQSLGVLIHVTNQLLRTNAAILKMMSENVAIQNKHEKVNSEHFRMQYDGLSQAFSSSPSLQDQTKLKASQEN